MLRPNNNLPYLGYGSSNQCYSNSVEFQQSELYVPDDSAVAVLTAAADSVVDNAVVRWDGTSGTLVQNSNAILSDAGNLTLKNLTLTEITTSLEDKALVVDAAGNVSMRDFPTDDLAIANVGAVPNSKGMTLVGNVLNLEPADATFSGVVNTTTQSFAGTKIFTGDVFVNGDLLIPSATVSTGVIRRQGDFKSIVKARFDNICLGTDAGNVTMLGARNVAVGLNAGESLSSASDNTFVGQNTCRLLTTGNTNTALGSNSGSNYSSSETNNVLISNTGTAGESNQIRIGNNTHLKSYCQAIKNNSISGNAVVIDSTTGELGMGSGSGAISLAAVGSTPNANAATVTGSTLNLEPASVSFPGVLTATGTQSIGGNKQFAGYVSTDTIFQLSSGSSSAAGYITKGALPWIHGGDSDVSQSVYVGVLNGSFSPSFRNTCMGYDVLSGNTVATQSNTAVGWNALKFLTNGSGNVAFGNSAGRSIVSGDNNIYLGHNGNAVTSESNKIRIGNFAHDGVTLHGVIPLGATGTNIMTYSDADASVSASRNLPLQNTTGSSVGNINFNGVSHLHNYTSSATKTNIFVGSLAGNYTCTQHGNTAVGASSLTALTSGINNTALGVLAGNAITTGTGNICIGNVGAAADNNKIYIGNTNHTGGTSIFGISGATSTSGVAVLVNASGVLGTTTSSQRFKHAITDITPERAALLHNLRPVDFFYNDDPTNQHKQEGLIAEEVINVFPEFVVYDLDGNVQTIQYHQLWPILLKEVQVQRTLIQSLQTSLYIMNQKWMILENKFNSGAAK